MRRSAIVYPIRFRALASSESLYCQPTNGGGIRGSRFRGRLVHTLMKGILKCSATLPPDGSFWSINNASIFNCCIIFGPSLSIRLEILQADSTEYLRAALPERLLSFATDSASAPAG